MRYERLEIDQTARDESDGFGVLVGVSVLELKVDLVCRQVTEGELEASAKSIRAWVRSDGGCQVDGNTHFLLGWSHTDDEHLAAKND